MGFEGRRVEIRGFSGNPGEEAGKLRISREIGGPAPQPLQLRIREDSMNRAVADRVERHSLPPAPALRHRMVSLNPVAEPAGAKPAGFLTRLRNKCLPFDRSAGEFVTRI